MSAREVIDIIKEELHESLITNQAVIIFQWVVVGVACQVIVLFGITTNIINIYCFVKQGFKNPINVSLTGLAVSDLLSLTMLFWTDLCFTPGFMDAGLPFDTIEFQFLTTGIPRSAFSRISAWITAFITLERCLCITSPFKIKGLITSKRVSVIIVCIYILLIPSIAPTYMAYRFGNKYFPEINKTLLGLVFTNNRENLEKISFITNNVFLPYSSFVVIFICAFILVLKLYQATKWRKTSIPDKQSKNISSRNKKVSKMVLVISTVFVICFFPISIVYLAMALNPEFSIGGRYINILYVVGGISVFLESINTSMNIFVYYCMSTKFRDTFRQLFNRKL